MSARPARKRLALFCHLVGIMWQLARRIPWNRLSESELRRVEETVPAMDRMTAQVRTARARKARR